MKATGLERCRLRRRLPTRGHGRIELNGLDKTIRELRLENSGS